MFSARAAMLTGAVLCFLAFLTIGSTGNIVLVVLGYSVLGGIGAGLVYATCINMVGKWYPERKGGLTGFVNGGFAYGSIPFIVIFNYWFTPANHSMVLYLVGVYMLVLMAGCGLFFKDPPKNWWPSSAAPPGRLPPGCAGAGQNPAQPGAFTQNRAESRLPGGISRASRPGTSPAGRKGEPSPSCTKGTGGGK